MCITDLIFIEIGALLVGEIINVSNFSSTVKLLTSDDEKKEVIITIQQRKYSAICLKELQIILFKEGSIKWHVKEEDVEENK